MKKRPFTAIISSTAMLVYLVSSPFVASSTTALAASPKLSKTKMSVSVGEKKVLKMKNTTWKVNWSIKAGKGNIVLKNKKKTKVTVKGRKIGTAVVKAVIKYSSSYKKTYTCKVTVTGEKWECPVCGFMNTGDYCANCGHEKPGLSGPTDDPSYTADPGYTVAPTVPGASSAPFFSMTPAPTMTPSYSPAPTGSPTPTPTGTGIPVATAPYGTFSPRPSGSPTPTPISPDALSGKYMWMTVNRQIPIIVQVYANNIAMQFFNDINSASPSMNSFVMGPGGDSEFAGYLSNSVSLYPSKSNQVAAGEVFLYDSITLKLSSASHATLSYPTRIARVRDEDVATLQYALSYKVDGKTWVEFAPYNF